MIEAERKYSVRDADAVVNAVLLCRRELRRLHEEIDECEQRIASDTQRLAHLKPLAAELQATERQLVHPPRGVVITQQYRIECSACGYSAVGDAGDACPRCERKTMDYCEPEDDLY